MKTGERIQKLRKSIGISQEELGDKIGVSRQAISKWESNQSTPSLDNLILLASIYNISVDELLGIEQGSDDGIDGGGDDEIDGDEIDGDEIDDGGDEIDDGGGGDGGDGIDGDDVDDNLDSDKIKNSNLTLIALIIQASLLNICLHPILAQETLPKLFLWLVKLIPLLACSIWTTRNLKLEINKEQYLKNIKIELLYNIIQSTVFVVSLRMDWIFLGGSLILFILLMYIYIINPKYMNRTLYNKYK